MSLVYCNGVGGSGMQVVLQTAHQSAYVTTGALISHGWAPPTSGDNLDRLLEIGGTGFSPLTLYVGETGYVQLYVNNASRAITADAFWPPSTPVYIEIQARFHNTLGFVTVRFNNVEVPMLSLPANTNTASTATAFATSVTPQTTWDNLYVCTGPGDSFIGACVVDVLYPNGNGAVNSWVGSDGNSTDNYLLIDEVNLAISDWVGSSTPGAQDLYTLPDIVPGTILGVTIQGNAQKTDAGARSLKWLSKGAGTAIASPAQALTTSFTEYYHTMPNDPEGGAWTQAAVNALQVGVEAV